MALTEKLNAIGDAIRSKTGKAEKLTLDAMAAEIKGITTGGDIPQERFKISGNCDYMFASPSWDWYIEEFGDKITTESITDANYMFKDSNVESIPFDLNFDGTQDRVDGMFSGSEVKEIGRIVNLNAYSMEGMFNFCPSLKYLPEFVDFNPMFNTTSGSGSGLYGLLLECFSLRNIPEEVVGKLYTYGHELGSLALFGSMNCLFSMDEIKGLVPTNTRQPENMFDGFGEMCCRWKEVTFKTNDDGTPINATRWQNQTIRLGVGYAPIKEIMLNEYDSRINNGITADKEVTDAYSYQALKNDSDWFTCNPAYSRYNHDSAVNTINSLPIVGSGCTIVFKGEAGSQTDGRAINTMTESEIAVAVAKGWTVSYS